MVKRAGLSLAQWGQETGRSVLVSWLGGEPLLWPALESISDALHAQGVTLSTTTNGTSLRNPDVRRHLCERYAELTVSVDGFAKNHDELRGRAGLFDELREGVRALSAEATERKSPLVLRANVVLMRRTIGEFPDLCHELASWGIREITCNQLGGADRPEFFPENRLLPEQVERLRGQWDDLRTSLAKAGARLLGGPAYLQRMAASSRDERMTAPECLPGQRFVFIDEAGTVAPCSFTAGDYGISLRELDSAEAWDALPQRFEEARKCRTAAACSDCLSTQVFRKFA
jgi:MoaA/NifB/PqqE/SkfB family radical SAM enzyme